MSLLVQKISKLDLCYYLDAQKQDGIDRGAQNARTGQVLALRDKLLKLKGQEFDLAIKTLSKMVDGGEDQSQKGFESDRQAAIELYGHTRGKKTEASKISPI